MHKPSNKKETHNKLLLDHSKTIWTFHQMVPSNELPTSIIVQYILAINYTDKRRNKIVAWGDITQDDVNLDNMDNDRRDHFEVWQHHNHMTDNRQMSNCIGNLNVDNGLDHDW